MKIKNNNTFSAGTSKSWITVPDFLNFAYGKRMYLTILITLFCLIAIHPSPSNDHRMTILNNQLLSIPTEWIICGPTSWEDLKNYLPEAKIAGVSVSVMLLPPFQSTPVCTEGAYSEPFGNDYIRWAQEIASLSLRYSNLTQFGIYELRKNLNLGYLRQTYIDSVITAGNSINPKLQFIIPYNLWYVDRDVVGGTHDGTSWANASTTVSALPWTTIVGGDTVYISGGVDSSVYVPDNIYGANPRSQIVVTKGWETGHNGRVVFHNANSSEYAFAIYNSWRIKLVNLTMKTTWIQSVFSEVKVILLSHGGFNTLENDTLISNGCGHNIMFNGEDRDTIRNCSLTIVDNTYDASHDNIGIYYSTGGNVIEGNYFYNGTNHPDPYAHPDCIQYGHTGSANNYQTIIRNNIFVTTYPGGNSNQGLQLGDFSAGLSNRFLIYNNIFHIRYEIGYPIVIRSEIANTSNDLSIRVFNNTVITGGSTAGAFIFYKAIDTLIAKNNIFVADSGVGNAAVYCGRNMPGDYDACYKEIDYNNYWVRGGIGTHMHNYNSYTWGDWKALGHDAHSDTSAVTFMGIWGTDISDYALPSNSPLIRAGTNLSTYFTTDILGNTRSNWSMGAIEVK